MIRGAPDELAAAIDALVIDISAAADRIESAGDDLLVVFVGSTGSGTSSVFNGVLGAALSPTGVRRPTTATPLVVTARGRVERYRADGLGGVTADVVSHPTPLLDRLTLVDAPDPDSVLVGHAAAVGALIRTADVVVYVTTPARYADAVPWEMFAGVQARGIPLIPVMNRIRRDDEGRLQVGHLVQLARLRGLVLDHDEVLRIPETPERSYPDAADLRHILEAIAEDDVAETRTVAEEGLVGDIVVRAEAVTERVGSLMAAAGRHASDRRVRIDRGRRALVDDLLATPPGVGAHGALIVRHRGTASASETVSLEARLVSAAAADLARRSGVTGDEAAAAVRRACDRVGADGVSERVDLLLGLGEHPPSTVPVLDPGQRRAFLTVLAEELLAEPPVHGIDAPVGLAGSLDALREAAS